MTGGYPYGVALPMPGSRVVDGDIRQERHSPHARGSHEGALRGQGPAAVGVDRPCTLSVAHAFGGTAPSPNPPTGGKNH